MMFIRLILLFSLSSTNAMGEITKSQLNIKSDGSLDFVFNVEIANPMERSVCINNAFIRDSQIIFEDFVKVFDSSGNDITARHSLGDYKVPYNKYIVVPPKSSVVIQWDLSNEFYHKNNTPPYFMKVAFFGFVCDDLSNKEYVQSEHYINLSNPIFILQNVFGNNGSEVTLGSIKEYSPFGGVVFYGTKELR